MDIVVASIIFLVCVKLWENILRTQGYNPKHEYEHGNLLKMNFWSINFLKLFVFNLLLCGPLQYVWTVGNKNFPGAVVLITTATVVIISFIFIAVRYLRNDSPRWVSLSYGIKYLVHSVIFISFVSVYNEPFYLPMMKIFVVSAVSFTVLCLETAWKKKSFTI